MVCDLCGKDDELFSTSVEGSLQNVCQSCSGYGKVIARVVQPAVRKQRPVPQEPILTFIAGSASKIRQAREALNLTQKELASQLQERESLLQKVENDFEPSIALAQKLEKVLHIKLIEEGQQEISAVTPSTSHEALTIGDLIKVKKSS